MAESASMSAGIAGRYATALFELAEESGQLDAVESDLASLRQALDESDDLRAAVASPVYSREEMSAAVKAVAKAMELGPLSANIMGLMAQKRRLFALGAVCDRFAAMMAERRGELTADVTVAAKLTQKQSKALSDALKASLGKDVNLNVAVDETLIGGLVVKVGSKLIDTSVRSKLAALQNAMREVG